MLGIATVSLSVAYPWVRSLSVGRGLLVIAATGTYLLFLAAVWHWRSVPRPLITSVGLLCFVAMCIPHPSGTDLWSYQMNGRLITEHHVSPYRVAPGAFPDDVIAQRTGQWSGIRSEYGPALVGVAIVTSVVASDSPGVTRGLWQGLCALGAASILISMHRKGISPTALAAFAFSPLVLYQGIHLAHVDMLLAALIAAALVVIQRHPAWALTFLAIAAMVKIPIAAAWLATAIWVFVHSSKRRALVQIAPSAMFAFVAVSLTGGRRVFEPMFAARNRTNQYTVWNVFRGAVSSVTRDSIRRYPPSAPGWMSALSVVSLAAICVATAVAVVLRRPAMRRGYPAILVPLFAYTLLSMYTSPWTYLWVLAPAAVCASAQVGNRSESMRPRPFFAAYVCFGALNHVASQWWLVTFATSPGRVRLDGVEVINRSMNALHYVALGSLSIGLVWSVRLMFSNITTPVRSIAMRRSPGLVK